MGTDSSALVEQQSSNARSYGGGRESMTTVVREIVEDILNGGGSLSGNGNPVMSLVQRSRDVMVKKAPRLKSAVKSFSTDLVQWMNRGGSLRAALVISVGIITLISLSGISAFLLFLVTATVNAAIVALLGSVAAVGAITALFFAGLVAIYVGALATAAFVISTVAVLTIGAVVTATGWITFWWIIFQGVMKCLQLVRGSLFLTGATIQTVSAAGQQKPIIAIEKKAE